jgi:hypothetical protein
MLLDSLLTDAKYVLGLAVAALALSAVVITLVGLVARAIRRQMRRAPEAQVQSAAPAAGERVTEM